MHAATFAGMRQKTRLDERNEDVLECVLVLWKETLEGSKTETSPIVILLLPPHRAAQLKEHCDATKRILPAFALTLLYV